MCIPFLLDVYCGAGGAGFGYVSKGDQVYRGWKGNTLDTWREVMRMPWAKDIKSLAEAVPPKYTEYIGSYIIEKFLKSG